MNFEEFDDHNLALDAVRLGVIAVQCETQLIDGLDGSIVLCSDRAKMRAWREAHGLTAQMRCETETYGDLSEAVSWEGAYHLDRESAALFKDCYAKDLRFRPEILTIESDEWTLVTSCFDPYSDPTSVLRNEMDSFVLGHRTASGEIVGDPANRTSHMSPFRFGDFMRASKDKLKMDLLARSRLASVSGWDNFLERLEEDR